MRFNDWITKRNERGCILVYSSAFLQATLSCTEIAICIGTGKKALENDCCVVIGIQTTGEASLNAAIEELGVEMRRKVPCWNT